MSGTDRPGPADDAAQQASTEVSDAERAAATAAPDTSATPERSEPPSSARGSALVAAGILLSRLSGLVRERALAYFFGTSMYADVFRAGLKVPNLLQNLLGEGTLSASFIPVYAELLEQKRYDEAGRVAGAILTLLMAIAGALALIGVLAAPVLVSILVPGFDGEARALTITVVRILFPMTALLVVSAWALGVLNSHRRFFVPYVAPVLWNLSIIASFFVFGGVLGWSPDRLAIAAAGGALVGGALQLAIQLPEVLRLERRLKIRWDLKREGVREAVRNAGPAIAGRGVVQLSGFVDLVLASLLAAGALGAIGYAQTLYMLPVSLFGMSVAAAELPELSRERSGAVEVLRDRTNAALARVAYYIVPTLFAFVALGDVAVAAFFQTGAFGPDGTTVVHLVLLGYSVGLMASTTTRLFSSAFFALRDTATPAKLAAVRVVLAAILGFGFMTQLEPIEALGLPAGALGHLRVGELSLGAVGLTLGAGVAAWIEWVLLRRALVARIGPVAPPLGPTLRIGLAALLGTLAGWGVRLIVPSVHPIVDAALIFGAFGAVYLGLTAAMGLGEAGAVIGKVRRRLGR